MELPLFTTDKEHCNICCPFPRVISPNHPRKLNFSGGIQCPYNSAFFLYFMLFVLAQEVTGNERSELWVFPFSKEFFLLSDIVLVSGKCPSKY